MKKKLFTLAAAMVLTLSMGMTALAANSPVIDDEDDGTTYIPSGYVDFAFSEIDGQLVSLNIEPDTATMISNANAAQQAVLNQLFDVTKDQISVTGLKNLVNNVAGYNFTDTKALDWFDLSLPAGQTIPAGGVKISLITGSVEAGDTVVLLHLKADGTWESVPVEVKDAEVIGTFTSLSPVILVDLKGAEKITPATPATTTPTTTTTTPKTAATTTAPKTGEFAGVEVAGMLALISAAGIVVYTKRQKTVR